MSLTGFALRRNITADESRCPASEEDCGEGGTTFRVCCPKGAYCPKKDNKDVSAKLRPPSSDDEPERNSC